MTGEDNHGAKSNSNDAQDISDDAQSVSDDSQSASDDPQSVSSGPQSVNHGAQRVEVDFLTVSVQRGRYTGDDYFAIGVSVSTLLEGDNTVTVSVEAIYGSPGQPDPEVLAREADCKRDGAMKDINRPSPPESPVFVVEPDSGRGLRLGPVEIEVPKRAERLKSYQARWDRLRETQTVVMAEGPSKGCTVDDSELHHLARAAFQCGWTQLDQSWREDLIGKRLTGTFDTSPLDQLSENVEKVLNAKMRARINDFDWSCLLTDEEVNEELHFFRYAPHACPVSPLAKTYAYKERGEYITDRSVFETVLFNDSLGPHSYVSTPTCPSEADAAGEDSDGYVQVDYDYEYRCP